MALKKMRVSFDIDIPVFLSMLAAANSGMNIDVFGDDKPPKLPKQLRNGHAPKLLEGPKQRGGAVQRGADSNGKRVTAYSTLLAFFAANKDRGIRPVELQPSLEAIGLAAKSVSPQLTKLRQDGFVKKNPADGLYHVPARGVAEAAKRAQAEASPKSEA